MIECELCEKPTRDEIWRVYQRWYERPENWSGLYVDLIEHNDASDHRVCSPTCGQIITDIIGDVTRSLARYT